MYIYERKKYCGSICVFINLNNIQKAGVLVEVQYDDEYDEYNEYNEYNDDYDNFQESDILEANRLSKQEHTKFLFLYIFSLSA